ncbi:mechanosensitive ion channel [Sinomicrobium weinanense]|uniref:Mechanosensitive ion channel n=1 Tax=Sinomicrobium weinanense TaxID=2842200 RepID=A0A926Q3M1_9FLAO|nr:mechanosensitive ion channel [Sinomicrobium weinanense]MBC9796151.1 mechanosensitive ion channel [Sinomicrobium weinanense]MBU3121902.1 mechanosensitive ion channel [Sinomicrobium weinanense]
MEGQLQNFANRISDFLPNLLGALLVLVIGWLIARGIKAIVVRLLQKTSWDEKILGRSVKDTNVFVGNIFYYVLMIIVLLIVLELLGISQVLVPVENMIDDFLSYIPNLIGAVLIGFVGYLLAKFISNLINLGGNLLDKIVDRTGFKDTDKLVNILKKVVFIIILVPFLIQAFNALELEAISRPANDILYGFTDMIGSIIVAIAVLLLFIWGGKFLTNFLKDLMQSLGLDKASEKIALQHIIGPEQSLSAVIANVLYFFLVFFGIITSVDLLELTKLSDILHELLEVTGQIAFGLLILVVGNFISLVIYKMVSRSNANKLVANIVRWASLALFIAIALRTMGIANEIVDLAFGLTLGAIAVVIALSYGLGGREAAGEHFREIIKKLKEKGSESHNP